MSWQEFKSWLNAQNERYKFAREIREGTTVSFSDEFAAHYDLSIQGFGDWGKKRIVVQFNLEISEHDPRPRERRPPMLTRLFSLFRRDSATHPTSDATQQPEQRDGPTEATLPDFNERFFRLSRDTWTGQGWELWYLDHDLRWVVVSDVDCTRTFSRDDRIQSGRIDFQFSLSQIEDEPVDPKGQITKA